MKAIRGAIRNTLNGVGNLYENVLGSLSQLNIVFESTENVVKDFTTLCLKHIPKHLR